MLGLRELKADAESEAELDATAAAERDANGDGDRLGDSDVEGDVDGLTLACAERVSDAPLEPLVDSSAERDIVCVALPLGLADGLPDALPVTDTELDALVAAEPERLVQGDCVKMLLTELLGDADGDSVGDCDDDGNMLREADADADHDA